MSSATSSSRRFRRALRSRCGSLAPPRSRATRSSLFRCNRNRIADYPNLSHYLKALYEVPGVKDTVNLEHITTHYYWSHTTINPHRIIPIGPELPFLK